jgi:hypothetical protein
MPSIAIGPRFMTRIFDFFGPKVMLKKELNNLFYAIQFSHIHQSYIVTLTQIRYDSLERISANFD